MKEFSVGWFLFVGICQYFHNLSEWGRNKYCGNTENTRAMFRPSTNISRCHPCATLRWREHLVLALAADLYRALPRAHISAQRAPPSVVTTCLATRIRKNTVRYFSSKISISISLYDNRGTPSPFTNRQDRRRFSFRPIEAHYEINWTVWSWQPIRFLLLTRRILLNIERQRPVFIFFHVR